MNTLISDLFDDPAVGHPSLLGLGVALYTLVAFVGRRDGVVLLPEPRVIRDRRRLHESDP